MPKTKGDWPAMLALILILVVFAGFIPQIFAHTQGNEVETLTIEEGETVILKPPLEATLISVDQNPGRLNITLTDTETGEIQPTGELTEGDETTVTIRGNTVSVAYLEAVGPNSAIISFEYPVSYEWNTATRTFVGAIALFLLVLFLYMLYILLWEQNNGDSK